MVPHEHEYNYNQAFIIKHRNLSHKVEISILFLLKKPSTAIFTKHINILIFTSKTQIDFLNKDNIKIDIPVIQYNNGNTELLTPMI